MDARANTRCRTKEEMAQLIETGRRERLREDAARRLRQELAALEVLKQLADTCAEAGGLDGIEVVQEKLRQMFPNDHALTRLDTVNHFGDCVLGLIDYEAK